MSPAVRTTRYQMHGYGTPLRFKKSIL